MEDPPIPTRASPDLDRKLDAALRAAYAPEEGSVLAALAHVSGELTSLCLREEAHGESPSPVIDPGSPERRELPFGRGNYRMLGEIARGGMGVVLKGHDTDLGRDVAVKVLRTDLARDPAVLQRFVEEAQIGGQLQHPGIVPVYELGMMADRRPYFTMKLVKGRTLVKLLADGRDDALARRRLVEVFHAVCQTMAYAHSRGVIHRDLKPSNVMVGAFGEVQVVDWGLAKVLCAGNRERTAVPRRTDSAAIATVRSAGGEEESASRAGSIMGTPAYMPPEQARGEVELFDERSDVFSLGAILCEILTGAPPYSTESGRLIVQATEARLDGARERLAASGADRELVELARDCLQEDPRARPRSAEVLAQRMQVYLASIEERARRAEVDAAGARVKAAEERRGRRLTVALAASVLLTVVLGAGAWAWMREQRAERTRRIQEQITAVLGEAALQRGQDRWADALATLERARGLAASGEAPSGIARIVEAEHAAVAAAAAETQRKREQAERNAGLLAALQDMRQPEGDHAYPTDWARLDREYAALFASHDLEPDRGSVEEAARRITASGLGSAVAGALDEWAFVRNRARDAAGEERLSQLAGRIDTCDGAACLRALLASGDHEGVRKMAAELDGDKCLPATTLNLLAAALRRQERRADAALVLRRAHRTYPGDFVVAMNLARVLLALEPPRREEALRAYSAALAVRPRSVEAAHELGRELQDAAREPEHAVELFRRALAVHPEDTHLLWHLGVTLAGLGDLEGASAAYRKAIGIDPAHGQARAALARIEAGRGASGTAIEGYRATLELDPQNFAARYNLGLALMEAGDFEGAVRSIEQALAVDPEDSYAQYALEIAQQCVEDPDGIGQRVRVKHTRTTKHNRAGAGFVGPLVIEKDLATAIASWRECVASYANPECMNVLAWLLATASDESSRNRYGALRWARAAVKADPARADYRNTLAAALLRADEWDECLLALDESMRLSDGGNGYDFALAAQAHARNGATSEAREWHLRGRAWKDQHAPGDDELERLLAEAESALVTPK